MNQSESNKIKELNELRNFFRRCEKEKMQLVSFEELTSEFFCHIKRIEECTMIVHQTKLLRKGKLKKEKKQALAKTAEGVAGGVFAFANMEGNRALRNAVRYTYSDFYRPHPKTTIGRCRQVLNAAGKIKHPSWTSLPKQHLEKFEKMVNDFEETVALFKNERKLHSKYTKEFKKELAETMNFLSSKMDPFMRMLSFYFPEVSGVYFNLRWLKLAGRRRHYKKSTVSKIKIGKKVSMSNLSEKITTGNKNVKKKNAVSSLIREA